MALTDKFQFQSQFQSHIDNITGDIKGKNVHITDNINYQETSTIQTYYG